MQSLLGQQCEVEEMIRHQPEALEENSARLAYLEQAQTSPQSAPITLAGPATAFKIALNPFAAIGDYSRHVFTYASLL